MSAALGSLKTKLKPTTLITFRRDGQANVINLGNVVKFSDATKVQRVEHFSALVGDAGGGVAVGDGNLMTTLSNMYQFTIDEIVNDNLRLLGLTDAPTAANQTASATQAISIADVVPGETYDLGFRGLTAHALTFAGSSKVEGTDFRLDYKAGLLTILVGGAITSGDDVAGTINVPSLTYKQFTGRTDLRVTGRAVIQHWDQFSESAPRQEITIDSADIYVTNWGSRDHTKWTEVDMEIYCNVAPRVKERQD